MSGGPAPGLGDELISPSHALLPRLTREAISLARAPLYRNASALILSTGVNGILGLVYWTLAARLYPAEEVGRGAPAVAALQLVGMLACTGVTPALIRFVPASGPGAGRLVRSAYGVSAVLALLFGAGYLVSTELFLEPLPVMGFFYLGAALVWVLFTLEDGVLIGLRRSNWVLAENLMFGLSKVAMLVVFSGSDSAWGIFASWSIAAALLVVPVNIGLFSRFIPSHQRAEPKERDEFELREIGVFTVGNHASGLLMVLPDFLMPIVVLELAGQTNSAYFYAAWTLVWPLRLISVQIANALTAEAARDEKKLVSLWKRAGLLTAAVFLPLSLILLAVANPALRLLFGKEYAANGDDLMRLLALGLTPYAFTALFIGIARVRRELRRLLVLGVLSSIVSLALSVSLIETIGIEGAGLAWLAAQGILALAAFAVWSLGLLRRRSGPPLGENDLAGAASL